MALILKGSLHHITLCFGVGQDSCTFFLKASDKLIALTRNCFVKHQANLAGQVAQLAEEVMKGDLRNNIRSRVGCQKREQAAG